MPFLIALVFILVALTVFLRTPQGRGWLGELKVKLVIGRTKPDIKYVINNLTLRIGENKTSQIDHVVINEHGVFVIETKNYSGRIYGNETQLEWTQVLNYGNVKNKLYNPIKQNKTHLYHISNLLNGKLPLFSAVVFVQGNTQYINASGVYNLRELRRLLKSNTREYLSPEKMEEAYKTLLNANDASITKREHIQNININKQNISSNICPRCGKALVLRKGKNGNFMGCKGYPQCIFTKNI